MTATLTDRPRRVRGAPIPGEGEDGLFTQSWFALCTAAEVPVNEVRGFDFLDGRVVAYRDPQGRVHVLSAFCPHLGADLSVGAVVDGQLRCAFHHWRYDSQGACVATMIGDPPPPSARLFRFEAIEKHGIIWVYNGETPHYQLPDFSQPSDELAYKVLGFDMTMPVDPWVLCANTPDIQHIKALHGITFTQEDPDIEWTDHSLLYEFTGLHKNGEKVHNKVGIYGTSCYFQETTFEGRWFGFLAPFGLPRPGSSKTFLVIAVRKDLGTPEEVQQALDFFMELEIGVVSEDVAIMNTIRFRPGTLTRSDRPLARFFDYLRAYPRAHPSADFIR
jgi:phenylpropionate dioxygenase-like ring-hydroxylating dioxygenase large terminal subunit